MDSDDRPPTAGALAPSTSMPIAQLSPEQEDISAKSVHAVVTLVWPYSSSSKTLSLLLAEPDFRLRRSQGQVKVNFHGISAQEVAQTHVGIGDEVQLSLEGVRWTSNQTPLTTPGRNVAWDLNFEHHVSLEVSRNSRPLASIRVDSPASPLQKDTFATPVKPATTDLRPGLEGSAVESIQWASPAFLRASRQSLGGFPGPIFDPFAEEDGYVPGKGRKRPRFSMRSNEWRLVDEPASPVEETTTWDELEDLDMQDDEVEETEQTKEEHISKASGEEARSPEDIDAADANAQAVITEESPSIVGITEHQAGDKAPSGNLASQEVHDTAVPVRKSPQIGFTPPVARLREQRIIRAPTDTPRLLPLPSPGLLVPSPLVTVSPSPQGYFPTVSSTGSSEPPAVPTGHGEDVTTTQNVPVQETPSHDLLQQAAEKILENAAADVLETSAENTEPVSSETAVGIGSQLTHFPTSSESGRSIISTSFQYAKHQVHTHTDEIAEGKEAEVEEIRSSSESVDTETRGFNGLSAHMKGSHREDREYQSGDYEGDVVEPQEYEDVEHGEGFREYDDESRGYSRSPSNSVEEDGSEDESEISDEEPKAETEHVLGEDMEADIQKESSEERLHDTASNVAEDEYDDMEEDEQYEEEFDEEYESDYVYEEEYEEFLSTDSESEDATSSTRPLESAPQRTIHPEVIVLDSDSEEEPCAAEHHPSSPRGDDEAVLVETIEITEQNDSLVSSTAQAEAPHGIPENEEDTRPSETGEGQQNAQHTEIEVVTGTDTARGGESSSVQEESRSPSEESRRSISHPFFTPDADLGPISQEHDENAIDPELLRTQVASRAAHDDSDDSHHQRDESLQSGGSPNLSQHADQGLFLDGPSSPRVSSQVESHRDHYIQFHAQLPTPNATQQTESVFQEPDFQIIKSEPMPTPQDTRDFVAEELPGKQPVLPDIEPSTHVDVASAESNDHKRANIVSAATQQESGPTSTGLTAGQRDLAVVDDEGLVRERQLESPHSIEGELHPVDHRSVQVSVEISHAKSATTPPPLPNRQARGLRSAYSYFAPLATLFDLFNSVIDTISVVVETSPPSRATSGSRDYFVTLQLTDPSMAGTVLPAQIFRPYKTVLPFVAEGDVILLRNFKVRTFNHSMMLLSTDSSAWAVFDGKADKARVTGPPVEYGPEERSYADSLYRWYQENGAAMVADYRLQSSIDRGSWDDTPSSSAAVSETGSMDSALRESRGDSLASVRGSRRSRKSHRRITIHELRDGTRYTEVGSPSDKESIHELRDGTVYANL